MPSSLTADMVLLLARGVIVQINEDPAHLVNRTLLKRCEASLDWLEGQFSQLGESPVIAQQVSEWHKSVRQLAEQPIQADL